MSDIVTVRDPDIIAAEINMIKKNVREVAIRASIEIGGKLTEAKSMVDHGQWCKWLEENVEYSQSTANYLMQLYQEYGTGQENLFDTWTKSQTFGKLSYSQHIALLALPFGERQAFAEENRVEEMSTRQLQQLIRERDAARQDLQETENYLEEEVKTRLELEKKLEDANLEIGELKDAAVEKTARFEDASREQEQRIAAQKARIEAAEQAQRRAEASERTALDLIAQYKRKLEDQEKILKDPPVPEDKMAQLRQEAEQAAAMKEAEKTRKQIEEAEATAKAAVKARETAEAQAKEVREQLANMQKQQKLTDPALVEVNALAKKWQQDFASINTIRVKLIGTAPETAGKVKKLLLAIIGNMQGVLEDGIQ